MDDVSRRNSARAIWRLGSPDHAVGVFVGVVRGLVVAPVTGKDTRAASEAWDGQQSMHTGMESSIIVCLPEPTVAFAVVRAPATAG